MRLITYCRYHHGLISTDTESRPPPLRPHLSVLQSVLHVNPTLSPTIFPPAGRLTDKNHSSHSLSVAGTASLEVGQAPSVEVFKPSSSSPLPPPQPLISTIPLPKSHFLIQIYPQNPPSPVNARFLSLMKKGASGKRKNAVTTHKRNQDRQYCLFHDVFLTSDLVCLLIHVYYSIFARAHVCVINPPCRLPPKKQKMNKKHSKNLEKRPEKVSSN